MKILRKSIFWLHLAAGLLAGVIILVMSVTGVALTYERQLTELADGVGVTPPSVAPALGLERLLAIGEKPTAVVVERDPSRPVAFQHGREKTVFVNPYEGKILGEGNTAVRKFFHTMLIWHRWLGREGASQPTGKAIIGAGNLVFLFLLATGICLWLPKRWTRSGVRAITLFQRRLKGRARDWNWHNVLGIWSALPLLALITTGAVMSYPWANALVFQLAGEAAPPPRGKRPPPPAEAAPLQTTGLDAALAAVKSAHPDWQTIQLQLPPAATADFTVMDSHRGRPDLRRQVSVDLATAKIVKAENFADQTPGRRARTWIRLIHTGEAGGFAGQTIAGVASAAAAVLVWTGFALSWRRFTKKRTTAA